MRKTTLLLVNGHESKCKSTSTKTIQIKIKLEIEICCEKSRQNNKNEAEDKRKTWRAAEEVAARTKYVRCYYTEK